MSANEVNALHEKLNRLTAEFEDFTYIVSHDFKAPLRAISNLSDWIVEDLGTDLQEDVGESLRLLKSRVTRMEQMLEAILAMSRVSRFDLDVVDTSIAELVREVASRLEAPETFEVAVTGNAQLLTYRKKLGQALELLLDNSARFGEHPGCKASISITEGPEMLEITVADNGPGVADHIQEKMFRMYSTTLTDVEPPATGKGLTLARRIAEFAGGSLTFNKAHTPGAAFIIHWPKAINAASDAS